MSIISRCRYLGLLIFILSILSINIILILSQIFEFRDIPVPGNYYKDIKIYNAGDALQDKQGLDEHGFAIPYLDGSTSISRLGRVYPNNLIFKPLMIASGFLICLFWHNKKKILFNLTPNNAYLKKMYMYGNITGVCLIIHIFFLGINIDNNLYKLFTRLILVICLLSGLASKYLFVKIVSHLSSKKMYSSNIFFLIQKFLVYILLLILLFSVPLLILDVKKSTVLILEWNYFVLIFSFYFLYFLSWNNQSVIQPPPNTL